MVNRLDFNGGARAIVLVWALLFFVVSCKPDDPNGPKSPEFLVEGTFVKEISKEEIGRTAASFNPLFVSLAVNPVKMYRITYKTRNVDGSEITASGAVAFPVANKAFPMLSVQHGTIFGEGSAPSNFGGSSELGEYGALFASLGYIAVFPDYIGYGASKDYPHPYEHRASLASACLDMLRAVKEFIERTPEYQWNTNLYISGFSEGGYATLSLQKKIEEEAAAEFNLKASTCGAGAYNKTAFMKYLVNNTTHGNASYNRSYLWVLLSYNAIYGINKPVSYYFKEPYATQIAKTGHQTQLSVSFNLLLKDEFIQAVNNGTDAAWIQAVADNDLLGWKPVTPTQLYHGTADELVYYFNTETAHASMVAQGATKVALKTLPGKTHSSAVEDYLLGTYLFFVSNP